MRSLLCPRNTGSVQSVTASSASPNCVGSRSVRRCWRDQLAHRVCARAGNPASSLETSTSCAPGGALCEAVTSPVVSSAGEIRERASRAAAGRMVQVAKAIQRRRGRLSPQAVVVRGGTMRLSDLEKAAKACKAKKGRPGISVYASADLTVSELIEQSGIGHRVVRLSTAGKLAGAGFTLEQSGAPLHHTVWMPRQATLDEELKTLANLFDEAIRVDQIQSEKTITESP